MNEAAIARPPESPGDPVPDGSVIVHCDAPGELASIRQPETELVILRRPFPEVLNTWLTQLELAAWPMIRVLVEPERLTETLSALLDEAGVAPGEARDLLVADIQMLTRHFANIVGAPRVEVRLESINDNACWKFHRDCVEARLLTTYQGPATEWVLPVHGAEALQEQKDYSGPLEQMQNGDVALFKGSCAGAGSGIVHRSPPIEGSGIRRLLLCLNAATATSSAHVIRAPATPPAA